jgi:hypothetical protein
MLEKIKIYLDDIRTPIDNSWVIVRNYYECINLIDNVGLENIKTISLDHDLGDTAIQEYFNNVHKNYKLDYNNITEKTGYDVAKWLVNTFYDKNVERISMVRSEKKKNSIIFPDVFVHSANPIGSANIMGYINNFLMNEGQPQTCIRKEIEHNV